MQKALGSVKPNSTTVALRATNNQPDPTAILSCEAIQFQVLSSNTGSVYICQSQNPTLGVDDHVEIPPPSSSPPTRPVWVVGNPTGQNPINAAEYWVLPANATDGVRITILVT